MQVQALGIFVFSNVPVLCLRLANKHISCEENALYVFWPASNSKRPVFVRAVDGLHRAHSVLHAVFLSVIFQI